MDPRETGGDLAGPAKTERPPDILRLWEQWDQTRKEKASSSDYTRGWNLVGVGLFIAGSVFFSLGSGWLKARLGPIVIIIGAVILAAKKIKSLWLERSLKR